MGPHMFRAVHQLINTDLERTIGLSALIRKEIMLKNNWVKYILLSSFIWVVYLFNHLLPSPPTRRKERKGGREERVREKGRGGRREWRSERRREWKWERGERREGKGDKEWENERKEKEREREREREREERERERERERIESLTLPILTDGGTYLHEWAVCCVKLFIFPLFLKFVTILKS